MSQELLRRCARRSLTAAAVAAAGLALVARKRSARVRLGRVRSGRVRGAGTPMFSETTRSARNAQLVRLGAGAAASTAVHQVRRAAASSERRAELDAAHELKTAEQVTEALGQMKGVLMKLGQMASYLNDGFPEQFRAQLATLQANASPELVLEALT